MKLTKTEQQLIAQAKYYGGCYSVETGYGRGAKGGKIQYGIRERNALFKLIQRGIAIIVDRQPWQDYKNGYYIGGNVIAFKLIKF